MKIQVADMSELNLSPGLMWHSKCFSQMLINNPLSLSITNPMVALADDSVLLSSECRSQQKKLRSVLETTLVCTLAKHPGSGEFSGGSTPSRQRSERKSSPVWGSPWKLWVPQALGCDSRDWNSVDSRPSSGVVIYSSKGAKETVGSDNRGCKIMAPAWNGMFAPRGSSCISELG